MKLLFIVEYVCLLVFFTVEHAIPFMDRIIEKKVLRSLCISNY